MDGVALQVNIRPGYLPAHDGAGAEGPALEDPLLYLDDIIVMAPDFPIQVKS